MSANSEATTGAIRVTLVAALAAYKAFVRIGEADLPFKASWDVGVMVDKLAAVAKRWDKEMVKLMLANGGKDDGAGGVRLVPPEQPVRNGQTDEEWLSVSAAHGLAVEEHAARCNAYMQACTAALETTVEIERHRIPRSSFEDAKVKANDVAAVLPFIDDSK